MRSWRLFGLLVAVLAVTSVAVSFGQGRGAAPPAGAPGAADQTPIVGTGFLAGQVVDVPSGKPVPDALVTLSGRLVVNGRASASSAQVIADAQGRFVFGSLPAGTFTISATRTGYLPPRAAPQVLVELANGEKVIDARVRLTRVASLSGTLRDEVGDPVVGTDVIVIRREVVNGRPSFVGAGKVRSDDRGLYRVGNLGPGDYLVCACSRDPIPIDGALLTTLGSDPIQLVSVGLRALSGGSDVVSLDNTLRTYAPTFHPNSPTAARATRVAVAAGEEKTGVDLNLEAVKATRVSGTVIGAPGRVQASSMRLFAAGESEPTRDLFSLPPILVQPDGRFDFAMVPPGQYRLLVAHFENPLASKGPSGAAMGLVAGGASTPITVPATMSGPPPDETIRWADELVSVGDKGVTGLAITLNRANTVTGRVEWVGAAPQPTAQMLNRATVPLQPIAGDFLSFISVVPGRFAPDSTFTALNVLPGKYAVNPLALPGFPTLKSVVVSGVDLTDLPLEVTDKDVSSVVITYVDTPLAALTITTNTAAGSLPFDDAWALLFPTDRKYWIEPTAARRRYRTTAFSNKGVATMDGLPAGEYFVMAGKSADVIDWQDAAKLDALSRRAQRITVADGDKKTIEVRR